MACGLSLTRERSSQQIHLAQPWPSPANTTDGCININCYTRQAVPMFIFALPAFLQGIWVNFVYEGHRVDVKVTGAKKV